MNYSGKLYLDGDQVLADFNHLAHEIFGESPEQAQTRLKPKEFWRQIRHYRQPGTDHGFYRALPLMPDAMVLFNAVKHLNPSILTGCPLGDWAPQQKVEWAAEHFPETRIITCMARDKILHMENPGDVLVDDMLKNQAPWEAGGGVFVHHTDAANSIKKLQAIRPEWFESNL